jgi:uncharacterized protein
MTPDERQLITDLFERMRSVGLSEKDREAEALISQSVRQFSDAPYMLVQSVLVQEQALQQAEQRIQELEQQLDSLERGGQSGSGSFLGGLLGGSRPAAPPARGQGSVPATGRQSAGFGSEPRGVGDRPGQFGGPAPMQAPQGGSFMRQAMSTAAGVAGGVLLANTISNMFGGGHAQAFGGRDAGERGRDSSAHEGRHEDADYQNDAGAHEAEWDQGGGDFGGHFCF